jgi:rhamnogalacturonan endolyase
MKVFKLLAFAAVMLLLFAACNNDLEVADSDDIFVEEAERAATVSSSGAINWNFQTGLASNLNYSTNGNQTVKTDVAYVHGMTLLGSQRDFRWLPSQSAPSGNANMTAGCIQTAGATASGRYFLRINNVQGPFRITLYYTGTGSNQTGRFPMIFINGTKVRDGAGVVNTTMTTTAFDYTGTDRVTVQLGCNNAIRLFNILITNQSALAGGSTGGSSGGSTGGGTSTSAPAVPSGLRFSFVGNNRIALAWTATASATNYTVQFKRSTASSYTTAGTTTSTSYTINNLENGADYDIQIRANNNSGSSAFTSILRAEIPAFGVEEGVSYSYPRRPMERLNRGLVAVRVSNGNYLSWRYLGTDNPLVGFNVYRNGTKINQHPLYRTTDFIDTAGAANSSYTIATVLNGTETRDNRAVTPLAQNYLRVPLQVPPSGRTPTNETFTYSANDASVGDVDGDGEYEIFVKWEPSNAKDNSQTGYTGNVYIDCYKMNGQRLWRIDLGRNIRAGAHYTQFLVYDLDGDGRAELICKTADGTIDGTGRVLGRNPNADNRNSSGIIITGNEYLTVFNGQTGAAIDSVDYDPPRSIQAQTNAGWGDNYGNRSERYLACVAYLDGVNPSVVFSRGYYTKTYLVAWRLIGGRLVKGARFYSTDYGTQYEGQGNHSIDVADVDGSGRDSIIFGSMLLDPNLRPVYSTRLGHGDAQHTSKFLPNRAGLQTFSVHESATAQFGWELRDTRTGAIIWGRKNGNQDVGRGLAANIDPRYTGAQFWTSGIDQLYDIAGNSIGTRPKFSGSDIVSMNFAIWWDGDVQRELLDGYSNSSPTPTILKFVPGQARMNATQFSGTLMNNGTKATPMLQADLFGDWREEVIVREANSSAMRIYTTTDKTNIRLYTLMHNPKYRLGVAWQNVAYNQPPHVDYYIGTGMRIPAQPNISVR